MRVYRRLSRSEMGDVLKPNYTLHMLRDRRERIEMLARNGVAICIVCAGFLVDNNHRDGLEEHYITNTGLIIVRNHNTNKLVTVFAARPKQIERYYVAMGHVPPSRVLQVAHYNTKILGLNH